MRASDLPFVASVAPADRPKPVSLERVGDRDRSKIRQLAPVGAHRRKVAIAFAGYRTPTRSAKREASPQ
jgi:hypothetical protein